MLRDLTNFLSWKDILQDLGRIKKRHLEYMSQTYG